MDKVESAYSDDVRKFFNAQKDSLGKPDTNWSWDEQMDEQKSTTDYPHQFNNISSAEPSLCCLFPSNVTLSVCDGSLAENPPCPLRKRERFDGVRIAHSWLCIKSNKIL